MSLFVAYSFFLKKSGGYGDSIGVRSHPYMQAINEFICSKQFSRLNEGENVPTHLRKRTGQLPCVDHAWHLSVT